jgi:type II secretory pathway component GspD/PulD (secretin)
MKCAAALLALALLGVSAGARITIDVSNADLGDVFSLLGEEAGINIVTDASVKPQHVTVHLHGVKFREALTALLASHDLQARRENGVLMIGTAETMNRRYALGNDPLSGVTEVFTMRYAQADGVAKELEGGLPAGTVIVSDKRTSSVIVTGSSETVARSRMLVAALDRPVTEQQAGTDAHAYPLVYLRPTQIADELKNVLPDGSFVLDDAQNAVVVRGNAETQEAAAEFLSKVDVPSAQVLFEVRVADVTPVNDSSDVGLEFGGYDLTGQPIAGATTYAFAKSSLAVNARLNMLVSRGHARILATPKLVTLNNKEADLLIGETYPVVYYDAHFGGQQVQFVDVGVKLRLTPTIGSDGSVTAEMHPEYSAIEGFVAGYPIIANRKIDSTLRVKDNETIVLGGLLRDIDSQTVQRVPWLADIPVFGKLFQDRQSSHERDEVVFLITPHVIAPNAAPPDR